MTDTSREREIAELHRLSQTAEDISRSTHQATTAILDACEQLQDAAPEVQADLLRRIYEACAVQDLTEQRLKRILRIAARLRGEEVPPDDPLLEGPQSEGGGVSQDDIDDILGQR